MGWRHYRHKPISALFNEKKATEAILKFLDKTEVGKMRGGIETEEDDEESGMETETADDDVD